jgi:hypothetical protein
MTHLQKFLVTLLMTLGVYCLLTLPFFMAFFTMDINTGHYYGLIYPTWLVYTCSGISVIAGQIIGNYLYNKSNK